jgi:serine phosphatase RsbU (regulator of sigma subunit)
MAKKRRLRTFQLLVFIILLIYILNLGEGILMALKTGEWQGLIGKIISFLLIGFIAYRSWEPIRHGRESYRLRLEDQREVGLKDAALFSLTWSREIYQRIPEDRKPLVQNAFILIAIALAVAYLQFGDLLTMLLVTVLIMAGVNLLVWVVASEREEKNRIQIELETARHMQMNLMPEKDPEVAGYDISGCCIPALDVGGDLFDYVWFHKEKKKLGIAVVDVSGKGMDAAFTAVYTSGSVNSEVQHQTDVKSVVQNINSALLSQKDRSRFVTLCLVALDVTSGQIDYVNAGQTRPLLLRGNQLTVLKNPGPRFPLGVVVDPDYQTESFRLESGDRVLLYTDGLNEAMNENLDMFGTHRLHQLFKSLGKKELSSKEMVLSIKDRVLEFTAPAQQHDDLTIVCIRVL